MPDGPVPDIGSVDPYHDLLVGGEDPPTDRRLPWVAICAVTSSDGVIAIDGSSRGIGGPADLRALQRIRRGADAVLVGGATVRAEGYDAAVTRTEDAGWRLERRLERRAAIVIVTRSLDLGTFGENVRDTRVVLLTVGTRAEPTVLSERLAANGSTLEVIDGSVDGELDWAVALERLLAAGLRRISCEGGPSVNEQLLTRGLVDEVFLTVAPRMLGARARTPDAVGFAGGADLDGPMRLYSAFPVGDELLVRYTLT